MKMLFSNFGFLLIARFLGMLELIMLIGALIGALYLHTVLIENGIQPNYPLEIFEKRTVFDVRKLIR